VEFTPLATGLLGAIFFCFLIQLYFSLFVHLRLARVPVQTTINPAVAPISVIICARNEAPNLKKFLRFVLEQDYPAFEVIVVNDRSWDGTQKVLEEYAKVYPQLKLVQVPDGGKFMAGKKFAVTMGIKAAAYDWLVFTDADCKPHSANWLAGMQQPLDTNIDIVLGYSPYLKAKSLLNSLIRFETFFTAVNYLSFAVIGMPYMGVGRNMAYKKSLFFKSKGFATHMHIPSGDDDLFVNANATKSNAAIQLNPQTFVWSEPNRTWAAYLKQKKRHFGAGKMYKAKHKFILSSQIIIQFLYYVLTIVAICLKETQLVAIGIFALGLLIRCLVYPRLLKRLNYPDLSWWFPVLDILLFVFLVFNGILSIFVKKVQWK
jgi:biofilm PGA synthesis N-glycosyltransferase PgaC